MKPLALFAPLLLGMPFCAVAENADQRPPNVIVILADDLGHEDLGCYGSKDSLTPNIDRLAREGVRCTSAYVSAPQCAPSRAGLLSGRSQSRFGFDTNFSGAFDRIALERGWGMPHEIKLIPEYLRPLGYTTGIIGKWHLGYSADHNPLRHGFDSFTGYLAGGGYFLDQKDGARILNGAAPVTFDRPTYMTDYLSQQAVDYIEGHKDRPFFLYLAHYAPHVPLQAPQKYLDRFPRVGDLKRRTYLAMISALDDSVGQVLDTLQKEGLDKNTLVFFLSDNGGPSGDNEAMGENTSRNNPFSGVKGDLLEGGIRVPYIVRWPGRLPAGATYEAPVSSLDILATSIAIGGGKPQPELEGIDILPYLAGRKPPLNDRTFYWRFATLQAVRSGDYKLIRFYPGVDELNDIRANFTEDQSRDLDPVTHAGIYRKLDGALTAWGKSLPLPMWKVSLPSVTQRGLERHGYKGHEPYRPGVTTLPEIQNRQLVSREIYKQIYGVDIDNPRSFQQAATRDSTVPKED